MEIVHKFQITSRENVQNNGLSLFPDLPKKKRQSEKVLYVKNIYIYIYIYKSHDFTNGNRPQCQTIGGENLQNNGLRFLFMSYQKQKDKKEKVLSVKKKI
jgi:hypothetical protein